MNNEQNNTFGIPNQVQPNNQTIPGSTVIPGANLTPIGPNNNVSGVSTNQSLMDLNNNINNVGVQPIIAQPIEQPSVTNLAHNPIPGIVTGPQSVNPPNIPNTPINTLPNENLISVNSNNVVPGIVNQTPVYNNNPTINNLNTGFNSPQALNTEAPAMAQPLLTPNIPVNPSSISNETMQPVNNNLGDATPLTNEGISEGGEVVSVWKYLGHMILFALPLIGFIMLLVKAFGGEKNKNIKNYAKAQLLFGVIAAVLLIALAIGYSIFIVSSFSRY